MFSLEVAAAAALRRLALATKTKIRGWAIFMSAHTAR